MILFARVGSPYKTKGHLPPAYLDTFNFYTIPRSSSESQSSRGKLRLEATWEHKKKSSACTFLKAESTRRGLC